MAVVSLVSGAIRRADGFFSAKVLVSWVMYSYIKSGFEKDNVFGRIPLAPRVTALAFAGFFFAIFSVLSLAEPHVTRFVNFARHVLNRDYRFEVVVNAKHFVFVLSVLAVLFWLAF